MELGHIPHWPLHSPFNAFSLWQLEGCCEHLSQCLPLFCPQFSRVPTSFRIKSQVPCVLEGPARPSSSPPCTPFLISSLPSPPPSLPLGHSVPAAWATWLFLQHARHSPASGPLHRLCPLPGMLFPEDLVGLLLVS